MMKKANILFLVLLAAFFCYLAGRHLMRSQQVRGVFTEMLSVPHAKTGFLSADSIRWYDFPISAHLDEGGIPDGLLDVTHPSVVYLPQPLPSFKHNLWLALTPYPESLDGECYENTCVYSGSYDEANGIQPEFYNTHQNPILFRDYAGFNSDPDLFFNEEDSLLYCVTRKQNCPNAQNVFVLQHSQDGELWTEPIPIFSTNKLSLCPCLLKVEGRYLIYVFNPEDYYSSKGTFDIWESSSLSDPDFQLVGSYSWPRNDIGIWHGDVIYYNNTYYLGFCGFNQTFTNPFIGGLDHSRYLWIARSKNGVDWQFYDKPLLKKSGLYRVSMFVDEHDRLVNVFSVHHREFGEKYPSGNRIGSIRIPMEVVDSLIDSTTNEVPKQ